jgi:hypothetical protein
MKKLLFCAIFFIFVTFLYAENKDIGVCGPPPPPKAAQASGAEGFAPLPLPAVPQRRTEKKNPPTPPIIVAKIQTGSLSDWSTDPNDINNLLIWMKTSLGVSFSSESKPLEQIDLTQVPVLYRTGHNAFNFTPEQRKGIRNYLLNGGLMIFDACCGKEDFSQSAKEEIKHILPEFRLKPISLDHPIFNCYYENAGLVKASFGNNVPSQIEGIEIACHMAVVFSPNDMSCGWDMHSHISGSRIFQDSALKIGANIMVYATATRNMGISAAASKEYKDAEKTKSDKLVIGQMIHEGDWNPDGVGLRNLLDTLSSSINVKMSFETKEVNPNVKDLSKYPIIYMTGHNDFKWNEEQVVAIRIYLENGGFIFADACCGRSSFDVAFRREMGKVLKPGKLEGLPLTHPLFFCANKINRIEVTEATLFKNKGKNIETPVLEYGMINNNICVIYSSLSLNGGWRLKNIPYSVGYTSKSALDLGVNIITFAISK